MPMRRTNARGVQHCSSPHCTVLYVLCYTVTITITTTIMTTSADYHQYAQHTHNTNYPQHTNTLIHTLIYTYKQTHSNTHTKNKHTHMNKEQNVQLHTHNRYCRDKTVLCL